MPETATAPETISTGSALTRWWPGNLAQGITAGAASGLLVAITSVTFGALIFSGDLASYLGVGLSAALVAAFVLNLFLARYSSLPGLIAVPQANTCVVLAVMAPAIARTLSASGDTHRLLPTLLAALGLTAVLTGVVLFLMGWFRLGGLMRLVPYPVVAGFMAATGWLLLLGAIELMSGSPLRSQSLETLVARPVLARWLPGVLFGVFLLWLGRRFPRVPLLATLVAAVAVFYLSVMLAGMSVAETRAGGWLLGPFPDGSSWQPLHPGILANAHWGAVLDQSGHLPALLAVTVVALALYTAALEVDTGTDLNIDRELWASGVANILAGFAGGGIVGYHAPTLTLLGHRMGGKTRAATVTAALVCLLFLSAGLDLIGYFPRAVLGGLLFFAGLAFLRDWLFKAWLTMPWVDFALILLIVGAVAIGGFIQGVMLGVGVAASLFVVNYSRVRVVKGALPGTLYPGNVERAFWQHQVLKTHGDSIHVLQLQGYLFFGTASKLLAEVRQRAQRTDRLPLRYLVIDFLFVTGVDSSAIMSFARMKQLAHRTSFDLVFTQLPELVRWQLKRGGLTEGDQRIHFFPDLSHGMEWCEDQLLQDAVDQPSQPTPVGRHLDELFGVPGLASALAPYLEPLHLDAGAVVFEKGETAGSLYFIESGQLTAWLFHADGQRQRLRSMRPGSVVGEVGFYAAVERSARVVADRPTVLYRLSSEALGRMEEEAPDLAAAFHRSVARLIAQRLARLTDTVNVLIR